MLRPRSPLLTVLTLSLFVFSCATTQLPPISSSGASFEPLQDESELWSQARNEERKLLDEAPTYDDPLLEDYLEGVVARLNPAAMAANRQTLLELKRGLRQRLLAQPGWNIETYTRAFEARLRAMWPPDAA